jgi:hypothetical protein
VFENSLLRKIFGPKRDEVKGGCIGKPDGRRPVGRQRCRWVDNTKMDLGDV